jgi:hypothetical protein
MMFSLIQMIRFLSPALLLVEGAAVDLEDLEAVVSKIFLVRNRTR